MTGPAGRRVKAAVAAVLIEVALGYALLAGLSLRTVVSAEHDLRLVDIEPVKPPVIMVPVRHVTGRHLPGRASRPNLKAVATEIVAPVPLIPPIELPPIVAAPLPGIGHDPSAGAAPERGPGGGSGGEGTGTGNGGAGYGDGGGTPSRWLRGRLKDSDYPPAAYDAGVEGTLTTLTVIGPNGRVTGCTVTQSSGSPDLDETTCRLIEQRFRYKPRRDSDGRAVPDIISSTHHWIIER